MSYEKFIISNSLLFASEFGIPSYSLTEFNKQNIYYLKYGEEFFRNTNVKILNDYKFNVTDTKKKLSYKKNEWGDILKEIIKNDDKILELN